MTTFTMGEFIKEHNLKIGLKDAGATRLIAGELRKNKFERVKMRYKGRIRWVWTNERGGRLSALQAKLVDIKF